MTGTLVTTRHENRFHAFLKSDGNIFDGLNVSAESNVSELVRRVRQFSRPTLCVGLSVLMHDGGYRLIEEWQFVVLDIDNFKLRVVAVFQKVVYPLCDSRRLPSRSPTSDDDSNL